MYSMRGHRRMASFSLVTFTAVLCLSLVCFPVSAVTSLGDVKALQQLQQKWGGDTLLWSGSDPCLDRWMGIICDATNTRVTSLYLVSRGLAGNIPPELGSLSALENLDLSFNAFGDQIPTELGSLTSLIYLSFQNCNLTGPIPASLGKLVNLTFFALNNNQLNGPIPSSLGALKKLKWFDVAYNTLTGHLPVSTSSPDSLGLDTWPVIEHYHLNDNAFTGPIPPELGLATTCLHMLLEVNSFNGSIPESFGGLSNLQVLNLQNNQLSGPIPPTLNKIIKNGTTYAGLLQIRVANNQLRGTVPNFDGLYQLEYVDFSNNPFDPQPFPDWLSASSSIIQTIKFENASLAGPLPADILSYPALQGLYLQNNQLNGTLSIPANLGKHLLHVSLQNNKITSIDQPNPNAKLPVIQLEGNPTCTGAGLSRAIPTVCNGTENPIATQWTSSLEWTNSCQSCKDTRLTLNPYTCQCSAPLIVTLQVRAPTFTNIDDEALWDSLKNQTHNSLGNLTAQNNPPLQLESSQIWVRDAFFNGSLLRVQVKLYFFSLTGEIMDQSTEGFIKWSFTTQKVKYFSPFKPEIVIDIISSAAALASGGSGSGSQNIGAIVGGTVGSVVFVGLVVFIVILWKKKQKKNDFYGRKSTVSVYHCCNCCTGGGCW